MCCSFVLSGIPSRATRQRNGPALDSYRYDSELSIRRPGGNHHQRQRLRLGRKRRHPGLIRLRSLFRLPDRVRCPGRLAQWRQFQRLVSLAVRNTSQHLPRVRYDRGCDSSSREFHPAFIQPARRFHLSFHAGSRYPGNHHGQQLLSCRYIRQLPLDVGEYRHRDAE